MKDKLPMLILFCAGLIVIIAEFVPRRPFSNIVGGLETWFLIIAGFAIVLGQLNLIKMNLIKVTRKLRDWKFHLGALIGFFTMLIFGILWGHGQQDGLLGAGYGIQGVIGLKPFDFLFHNMYQHLIQGMFSLLAFFIASAAYRAFIERTFESTLMLLVSVIVMLGNTGIGAALTNNLPPFLHLPLISEFIMEFPNTAGQRAILIGAGLGVIGSSLRILLGLERSWSGGK
jgi:hypothetical protein